MIIVLIHISEYNCHLAPSQLEILHVNNHPFTNLTIKAVLWLWIKDN